jgi:pimeloyl-ACP methyl ester carboxylesterase/DNA-binding CsgD family transcriptional regulator
LSTRDGYDIAYTVSGQGLPLVCTPLGVFNHVQLNWKRRESIQPLLQALSERFRLVHFDCRGQGLSTRGLPEHFNWHDAYRDLEAVVEHLGLDHFVLVGSSTFTYIAVRYAAEHPERIRALTLLLVSPSTKYWLGAYTGALPAENWELFLRSWPAAGLSPHEMETRLETLRQSITPEDYMVMARTEWDITELLPQLRVPTLVLHPRGQVIFQEEHATAVAAAIPNSRLVIYDAGLSVYGDLVAGLSAIDDLISGLEADKPALALGGHHGVGGDRLPTRQLQVLRLIAEGKTNGEIADELAISLRTVERHAAEIYARLGVRNRVEAAAYAMNRLAKA